jgi:hypothetical protein
MTQWKRMRPDADEMTAKDRHAFLANNIRQAKELLLRHDRPVAIVGDLRHKYIKGLAKANGSTDDEIAAEIEKHRQLDSIPTITVPMTWDEAEKFMPLTSPTGGESVAAARKIADANGGRAIIAIMGKANSYVVVPDALTGDGAHRHEGGEK